MNNRSFKLAGMLAMTPVVRLVWMVCIRWGVVMRLWLVVCRYD